MTLSETVADARPSMIRVLFLLLGRLRSVFRARAELFLENLALRQQLAAFMLGLDVSERTVSRYLARRGHDPMPCRAG